MGILRPLPENFEVDHPTGYCPDCGEEVRKKTEDNRFDAHAPHFRLNGKLYGPRSKLYGSVDYINECEDCGAELKEAAE